MNLRANAEQKFLLKYLVIGLLALGFGVYSTYDAFVKYPNKIPQAKAWEDLNTKIADSEILSDADLAPMWKSTAKENGWDSKRPDGEFTVKRFEDGIAFSYLCMALGFGFGIPCLIWYFFNKGSWIESTSDGLRSSKNLEIKLSEITKFDKRKWEKKGIGVVHFERKNGDTGKFVIDDLKHERQTTDKIVAWMESQIPAEMIVNGPTEAQTNAKKKAVAEP